MDSKFTANKAGMKDNKQIEKIIESLRSKNRFELKSKSKIQKDNERVRRYQKIIESKSNDPFSNIEAIKTRVPR